MAQSCPTLCDPMDVVYQVSPSMGFSRQEYRSGLPFPSPGDLPDTGVVVHTFLGSLLQSRCGEGGSLQTNNTGMCSQCLSHTGPAPAHRACALPVHTAQALGCSAGNRPRPALGCMHFPGLSRSGSGTWVVLRGTDSVGPAFCALPRSKQLR